MIRNLRENETFLYGGNVTHLIPRPLYLYPNLNYHLRVVIEQEPLKLFDVFRMTTSVQRSWLRSFEGISEEYLLPYLVQCRAAWGPIEDENFYPGFYRWLFEPYYPNTPNQYFGTTPNRDRLFMVARRTFIPRVDVYIAGELQTLVSEWHGSLGIVQSSVVTPSGTLSCISNLTMNNHPHEALYLYAKQSYSGTTPDGWAIDAFNKGWLSKTGGGEGWSYTATLDGYGRMTIDVYAEHREIELRCSAEQLQTNAPADMGFCGVNSCKDYAFDVDGSGTWEEMVEYGNPVGYHGAGSADPFLAAQQVYDMVDWLPTAVNTWRISTAWDFTGTTSVDNQYLDWDSIGNPGTHKLHMLAYWSGKVDHTDPTGPSVERVGDHGIGSPLLVGLDKPEGPFALFMQATAGWNPIDPIGANDYVSNGDAIVQGLWSRANARKAFNAPQQGPRVKISVNFTQTDPDTDAVLSNYKAFYYCDLPYSWNGVATSRSHEAFIKDTDPRFDSYTDGGGIEHTVVKRESSDWHTEGVIGAGTVFFNILADGDGVDLAQQAGGTLGAIYSGPNSYIYYPTDATPDYATFVSNL